MAKPFAYVGGKTFLGPRLVQMIPEHRHYLEPFFGSGALYFAKSPAVIETVNDIDEQVANFWMVLRDHTASFIRLASFTPHSRLLFMQCVESCRDELDPVRRAWMWWVVARQSRNGTWGRGWCYDKTEQTRGYSKTCSAMMSSVDGLADVAARLRRTQIESRDGIECMERWCTSDTFCYCDPPYIDETRTDLALYMREMTMFGHDTLVRFLIRTNEEVGTKFMLSGKAHPIYEQLEQRGWYRVDLPAIMPALVATSREGKKTVESVWLDPITTREVEPDAIEFVSKCT